ncbi:MAG: NAD(P)-dependent oxidoreductase [Porticoccaceae bacterium]|jgi:3-hydroxyisobutyrate dehydrogenase-like beta-hydroxyacid dehydrogenase|nr:NAD(P)-dependent oxidoreductase [Porticoccaceae bacterium]MEA3300436.1 NAD(P)-dependent oxidoreductase [Pseudomonadota bacterium]HLS98462.1 NAD(P)-dependent oxidoreductase [Porticoccaceae bacterium]
MTTSDNTLRAGVIGLGQIGGGVAVCLARHNRPLTVYDVRPDAADKLEGVPPVVDSPAAVARASDVLMIAVLNGKQAREVLEGPNGVLAAAHPGLTLVMLSTITMDELRDLVTLTEGHGVPLLDCGVTAGGLSAQGEMISMIGGDDAVVARIMPVLKEFNAEVHHMGGTGAGMATKIARNMIHFTVWRAGFEGARLASQAGVDIGKFIELVENASHKHGASVTFWMDPTRIAPGTDPKDIGKHTLTYHQKDMDAARELAEQLGIATPTCDVARVMGPETYRQTD